MGDLQSSHPRLRAPRAPREVRQGLGVGGEPHTDLLILSNKREDFINFCRPRE